MSMFVLVPTMTFTNPARDDLVLVYPAISDQSCLEGAFVCCLSMRVLVHGLRLPLLIGKVLPSV